MMKINKIRKLIFLSLFAFLVSNLILLILLNNAAYADDKGNKVGKIGCLAKLNISAEEYAQLVKSNRKHIGWQLLSSNNNDDSIFYFYDSLLELQMSLERGNIDEAALPQDVATYVLNVNDNLKFASIEKMRTMSLAFGFTAKRVYMRDQFNQVIEEMKADGTLLKLQEKYLFERDDKGNYGKESNVVIDKIDGVDTITVAVTGDMPPIDYTADDGEPSGFSTAVLSEISKRLNVNINLVDIDAGARAAALSSGRVDAVFWFSAINGAELQPDVPQGIILSDSYYDYDKIIFIKRKD